MTSSTRAYYRFGPVLNLALAGLCLWLVVGMARDLSNTLEQQPSALPSIEPVITSRDPGPKAWSEREMILVRNLFASAMDGGAEPQETQPLQAEAPEEVQPTELPLGLLGTIASNDSRVGVAAVWVDTIRSRVVLTEGDRLFPWNARVIEIARRRVLLSEDGELRELSMDGDSEHLPPKRRQRVRRGRRQRR